ncbi:hypothetical protein AB0B88_16425 [Micromonospora haikouensis]|uniref:hypothetical protein n=1 Tax=Actinomycetes TaxID=1760 RepID=UPI0033C4EE05
MTTPATVEPVPGPRLLAAIRAAIDTVEAAAFAGPAGPVRIATLRRCNVDRKMLGLYDLDYNDDGEPIHLGGYGEAYDDVLHLLAEAYDIPTAPRPDWVTA